jgi:hypothetical protein
MRTGRFLLSSMTVLLFISVFGIFAPSAEAARRFTVSERIEMLSKSIERGRNENELTTKQEISMRDQLAGIKDKIEKLKEKNSGKLSLTDARKIHKDINNLSVQLLRARLDNVYN